MSTTAVDRTPGSEAWLKVITASKVAAVLGVSIYDSPRSLYHQMRGDVVRTDEPNDVQSRGHYLEPAILAWFYDQHPELQPVGRQVYATRPEMPWAAATLDSLAFGPTGHVVVEAKSSANDDEWGKPGTDEIPAYYAAQVIWGMHLASAPVAYVPIITSRLEFREYVVAYDKQLALDIEARCHQFWLDVQDGTTPPLDDHVATFESLRRANPDIARDMDVELDVDVARRYLQARIDVATAKAALTGAGSVLLEAMGTARMAKVAGASIARRQNTSSGIPALYPAANGDEWAVSTLAALTKEHAA